MPEIAPALYDLGYAEDQFAVAQLAALHLGITLEQPRDYATYNLIAALFEWHRDCEGTIPGGQPGGLLVWADRLPTEIRSSRTGVQAQTLAKRVYLFDNTMYDHRTPLTVVQGTHRLFIRGYHRWGEPFAFTL